MQSADLSSNFFVLFGLPVSFEIDRKDLAERYRELQRTVHPDKFANAAETERRLSVQMAALINEAYQSLKDPLARGRYILELRGVEINDLDTAFEGVFLMEQMELRERLEDVKGSSQPLEQLQNIMSDLSVRAKELTDDLAYQINEDNIDSLQIAKDITRKMQFFKRLKEEANVLEDELTEY